MFEKQTRCGDCVMDVVEWLEQVEKLDEMINAKMQEREQLMAMATKCTANMDGMPHGSGISDPVGTFGTKLAELAQETNAVVDRYIERRQEVIAALEKLPAKEYGALHRHYIRFMPWEDVAVDMQKSKTQVYRYKERGIARLGRMER
jgi:DNA-directed RNA polymerase specialized sigma24 family protein